MVKPYDFAEGNLVAGEKDPLSFDENKFRAFIVGTILAKETERAVSFVCKKYGVKVPKLEIGLPKGKKKALGVYQVESNSIAFRSRNQFFDPFVVLHELYHCIRSVSGAHRGTEKNADAFAISYIEQYNKFVAFLSSQITYRNKIVD